jgi:hypothetical protein
MAAAKLRPPLLKATITEEVPPALFCTDLTHPQEKGWILLRQFRGGPAGIGEDIRQAGKSWKLENSGV